VRAALTGAVGRVVVAVGVLLTAGVVVVDT
jgi:hypothetical protein